MLRRAAGAVSPKNKGKFGKAKPDIEVEDEFVSGVTSFAEKLAPYARKIVAAVVAFFLVVAAVMGYRWYQERREARATEIVAQAMEIYQQPVVSEEQAALFAQLDIPGLPEVTHPSAKARAEAALAEWEALVGDYGDTDAARHSQLFFAGVLYDAQRYDEAAELYRAFAQSDAPAEQRAIAREGVAYTLEAQALAAEDAQARQAGLEQALAAFEKVQERDDGFYRDYALYHQGRVLESLDRRDDAVAMYQKVLEQFPSTPLRQPIDNRLAALGVQ